MKGRFEPEGLLGTGGQGRVFAVRDAARGGTVLALKERSVEDTDELLEEFELLSRLRHPHIAAVHDWLPVSPIKGADSEAPRSAYTQDLVAGTDFFTALRNATSEAQNLAVEQVFRALAYLHALHVVHLDLKPDNVLVHLDGANVMARVLDFGVAQRRGDSTERVMGSRSYVAPERLRGDAVDPRADLFAVGVMMAEVSSGEFLSLYQNPELAGDGARRQYFGDIGVSAAWLDTVVALTAFEPGGRPATIHEAARLFEHGIRRTIALHTPATIAAILRAGAPVGQESLLAELRDAMTRGGAHVLIGPKGIGRGTLARQVARRRQLEGVDVEVWPGGVESQTTGSFAATLERLLGLDTGFGRVGIQGAESSRRTKGVDVSAIERRLRTSVVRVAERILAVSTGHQAPLLVVDDFEDAPWPVRLLLTTLIEAHEDGSPLPLGLLVVAAEHTGPAATPVEPMTRDDVARLLDQRLGPGLSSDALAGALTGASGGHPGALEALLTLMTQRGELRFGPHGWVAPDHDQLQPLPAAFGAAVQARLELLSEVERGLLSAVAWMRFPVTEVGAAAALGRSELQPGELQDLVAIGLLRSQDDATWVPSHDEVREALSGWEPPGGEAVAHQRVLEVAEPVGLARAWHVGGAEGGRLALAAGEAAWSAGAMRAAQAAFTLADELWSSQPDILSRRADVADLLGPREVQVRCLEQLIELEEQGSLEGLRARARLLWSLTRTADVERAAATGAEVLEQAEALDEAAVYTAALVDLANVSIQRGAYDEGEERLLRAQARTDSVEDPGGAARISNNLGNILAYRGEHEAALAAYGEALRLKTVEGDPVGTRIAVGNMGLMCLRLGRSGEALRHFAASFRAAQSLGHRRGEAWSILAIAELAAKAGAWAFSERRAQRALALAEKLGDRTIACDARTTLAQVAMWSGRLEEAHGHATEGLAEALAVESSYNASAARVVLAELTLADEAERARGYANAILAEAGTHTAERATALRVLAEVALAAGDVDLASQQVEKALKAVGDEADERVWLLALRLAGLRGDEAGAATLASHVGALLEQRESSWPVSPCDDGVDQGARLDGPSRKTWCARSVVHELRTVLERFGVAGSNEAIRGGGSVKKNIRDDVRDVAWCDLLVDGAKGIAPALAWLRDVVKATGAERGFVLGADDVLLASADADGDRVADAARKVPAEAVGEAVRAGGVWCGAAERGAIWAGVMTAPGGIRLAVILQNRFARDAFAELEGVPDPGRLRLLSYVLGLRQSLESESVRAQEAESTLRSETVRSTEHLLELRRALEATREQLGPKKHYSEIIYDSSAMQRTLMRLERVVDTDLPVWIYGESGTGKELVARALHRHGVREPGPFVAQNCGAIPAPLFESEFFGHVRGAFTGAHRDQEGLFRRADGGTLFLDEVGDLPLEQQTKLLRVLETGEVQPVGADRTVQVDVRVVCATHQDLASRVSEGAFREDLYYRLNVVRIDVPPLRERPGDIPVLVEHFLRQRPGPDGIPLEVGTGVMRALMSHAWPGNVRELENEVTRAALLCDGVIGLGDLSGVVRASRPQSATSTAGDGLNALGLTQGSLKQRVDRLEYVVLKEALARLEQNKSKVAREMGLSRAGLNMKLKRLGLWETA